MTLTFHALWMLCALGAVVFAAAARTAHERLALLVGFAFAVLWASPVRLPDASVIGLTAAAAAALYLFRPRFALAGAAVGGFVGGISSVLLEMQGVPTWISPVVPAGLLVVSTWLARTREAFAPQRLRDEGLLAIAVLGIAVAILPGILDGWQAAANFAATSERASAPPAVPMWTAALLLTSMSLGALYSLWSRR